MSNSSHSTWYRAARAFTGAIILLALGYGFTRWQDFAGGRRQPKGTAMGFEATRQNYTSEILHWSEVYGLPPAYFLALAQLECGGRRPAGTRFEKHVYTRLQDVRSGDRSRYEAATSAVLADATDDALRNLSTSWGPFQLMGYKCVELDIQLRDIRGEEAIRWGIHWIDLTYGDALRGKKFRNAFHIHNTGRPFPTDGIATTYDPRYVEKGMEFMSRHSMALPASH